MAWIAIAAFGLPLFLSALCLGRDGARRFFDTPRGALVLGLDVAGGMFLAMYESVGWIGLVVFLIPLVLLSVARGKTLE